MGKLFSYGLDLRTFTLHRFNGYREKWNWVVADSRRQAVEEYGQGIQAELGRLVFNAVRRFNKKIAQGEKVIFPVKLPEYYIKKISRAILKKGNK